MGCSAGVAPRTATSGTRKEQEWGKAVHGWSRKSLILWDNFDEGRCFGNPKLARIITNPETSDRRLGNTRFSTATLAALFSLVTGNNITLERRYRRAGDRLQLRPNHGA